MAIGALLAVSGIGLQAYWHLISIVDWQEHWLQWVLSAVMPPAAVLSIHLGWRATSAPFKVHREREQIYEHEIGPLRAFKRAVENSEVKLELTNCYTDIVTHEFPDKSKEEALALRITFKNKREAGIPGKTAKQVAATITYADSSDGKTLKVKGRWAQTTQPEALSPLESKIPLLRIDFLPGDDFDLDIAAKFPIDVQCFAIDNDSFPKIRHERTMLTGPLIRVRIELVSENVEQFFVAEIVNSEGKLECKSAREEI